MPDLRLSETVSLGASVTLLRIDHRRSFLIQTRGNLRLIDISFDLSSRTCCTCNIVRCLLHKDSSHIKVSRESTLQTMAKVARYTIDYLSVRLMGNLKMSKKKKIHAVRTFTLAIVSVEEIEFSI